MGTYRQGIIPSAHLRNGLRPERPCRWRGPRCLLAHRSRSAGHLRACPSRHPSSGESSCLVGRNRVSLIVGVLWLIASEKAVGRDGVLLQVPAIVCESLSALAEPGSSVATTPGEMMVVRMLYEAASIPKRDPCFGAGAPGSRSVVTARAPPNRPRAASAPARADPPLRARRASRVDVSQRHHPANRRHAVHPGPPREPRPTAGSPQHRVARAWGWARQPGENAGG
jgi:hypothetical protein